MNWEWIIGLNFLFFAISTSLIKVIVKEMSRAQLVFLTFLFCTIWAVLFSLFTGSFSLVKDNFLVLPLGFFVAFGAYSHWQAIRHSLSKTNLFLPLADVLTVLLAAVILNEFERWSWELGLGVGLCIFALFLFSTTSDKESTGQDAKEKKRWLFFITAAILIFGTSVFLMKYFEFIPWRNFLVFWYAGATLGAGSICALERNPFIFRKLMLLIPFAAIFVAGNVATQKWALELGMASEVVPFRSVGVYLLPILIGWLVFKERRGLKRKEWLAFLIGIAGALLIIL